MDKAALTALVLYLQRCKDIVPITHAHAMAMQPAISQIEAIVSGMATAEIKPTAIPAQPGGE